MISDISQQDGSKGDDVDFDTAVADPAAFYAEPEAIVADSALSLGQKERFLREWALDLEARNTADDEGMLPDDSAASAGEAVLLRRVKVCLETLDGQVDADQPGRSWWRRLLQN